MKDGSITAWFKGFCVHISKPSKLVVVKVSDEYSFVKYIDNGLSSHSLQMLSQYEVKYTA